MDITPDAGDISPDAGEMSVEAIILADGAELGIRPIAPHDVAALVEFHEHLASRTVYRRFFSVHPHLGVAEAERFCNTDSVDRFALVALSAERNIVGVARMERVDPAVAEVAFVIADEFQARGLGRVLVQRLAAAARERGVTQFVADTLADNLPMLKLLPDAGFPVTISTTDGVAALVCSTTPASGAHLVAEAVESLDQQGGRD